METETRGMTLVTVLAARSKNQMKVWLRSCQPRFKDRRFWTILISVLLITGLDSALDMIVLYGQSNVLGLGDSMMSAVSFIPVALFFVPVVYAALNFGLAGSIATAALCTLFIIPDILWLHEGWDRVHPIVKIGIIDAVGFFVGQRVDREIVARRRAETASAAHEAEKTKYRTLFNSSPVAILVLEPSGTVLEANPAAATLLGKPTSALPGMDIRKLVEDSSAEAILGRAQNGRRNQTPVVLKARGGADIYLDPQITRLSDDAGKPVIQTLLRDVTEEHRKQAGLRTYATHVLRVQEDERKRIAQELHDDTISTLVQMHRQIDGMERIGAAKCVEMVAGLQDFRKTVERAMRRLREFAKALRPPALDDFGVVICIRGLLRDMEDVSNVHCTYEVVGKEMRLPSDVELNIFRITQEALRNIERHAKATRVSVTIAFTPRAVTLDIADNGVSFSPARGCEFVSNGRLGLLGMRERAESLGGELKIQASPGQGTTVTVSVPVTAHVFELPSEAEPDSAGLKHRYPDVRN